MFLAGFGIPIEVTVCLMFCFGIGQAPTSLRRNILPARPRQRTQRLFVLRNQGPALCTTVSRARRYQRWMRPLLRNLKSEIGTKGLTRH